METEIVRSITCTGSREAMAAWSRMPESRRCWPGARQVWGRDDRLFYQVSMHVPGAPDAELHVEEHLRPVKQLGDGGLVFEGDHQWLWPSGEVATAWTSYRFSTEVATNGLEFTMRYLLPGSGVGAAINRIRFGLAMERAVERYLACLAATRESQPCGERSLP